MKNVLNVFCICSAILFHQDKYSMEIPAVSLNMLVLVNDICTVAVHEKRKSPVTSESKNVFNYPNPFSSSTTISYKISSPGYVSITLYDLLGREVCGYNEGFKDIGESEIEINLIF